MFDNIDIKLENDNKQNSIANMLAILDPEHGIVIDDKIGLIGEFKNKSRDRELKPEVGYPILNRELNQRGDWFEVVGDYGEVLFTEKITHTMIMHDNGYISGYAFILKDIVSEDLINDFFNMDSHEDALIIYKNDRIRTNCKFLTKYEYDKDIFIHRIDAYNSSSWIIKMDNKLYSTYVINLNNNILGLR